MINSVARAFAAALVFGVTFPAGALIFSSAVIFSKAPPEKPISATTFELATVAPSGKPIRVISVETMRPSPARRDPSFVPAPSPTVPAPSSPAVVTASPAPSMAPTAPILTACRLASERLAKLRAAPTLEEVERFSRELTCDELRPQIARLLESVGAEVAVVAPKAVPLQAPTPVATERSPQIPTAKGETCKRDSELLARLRANPTLEGAERFSRELACEGLRAQTARLVESLGG
jgi:hypothetical protein